MKVFSGLTPFLSHPTCDDRRVTTRDMHTIKQLEFGLERPHAFTLPARRPERRTRAQWWFRQMRQVVSDALEWQPAPAGRPEQVWLGLPAPRWQRHG